MARVSPLVLLPPVLFIALAALFAGGMFREDPDALPSVLIGRSAPPLDVGEFNGTDVLDREALNAEGVKIVNFWPAGVLPAGLSTRN